MNQRSFVFVSDAGSVQTRGRDGVVSRRDWGEEKSVVEVTGWVRTLCRERGKLVFGSRREGHNTWTNTGSEFLAMLSTLKASDGTPYRNDRVAYLGVGTGMQPEDAGVTRLVKSIPYAGSVFLAPIDIASTSFPLSPNRTTVRYVRVYAEDQITVPGISSVLVSELGLYTNGNQNSFVVDADPNIGRNPFINAADLQSPVAYKNLGEPAEKTNGMEFQVEWEIRFR